MLHFSHKVWILLCCVALAFLELSAQWSAILLIFNGIVLCVPARARETFLSTITLLTFAYVIGFAFPVLFPESYSDLWSTAPAWAIEQAAQWATRGFAAFALGYIVTLQMERNRTKSARATRSRLYCSSMLYFLGLISLLAMLITFVSFGFHSTISDGTGLAVESGASTVLQILTLLSGLKYSFFLGYVCLRNTKSGVSASINILFYLLISMSLFEVALLASKGAVIKLILCFLLSLTFLPRKWSGAKIGKIAVAAFAIYLTFSTIAEYRYLARTSTSSGDGPGVQIQIERFKTAFLRSVPLLSTGERKTEVRYEDVASRFGAGMFSFANLIKHTGGSSPFENSFTSFLAPVYAVLPRSLVPGKAVFFDSGMNARNNFGWDSGGISVTLLGSFYYSWGFSGILFGMFAMGGLLASVTHRSMANGFYAMRSVTLFVMLFYALLDVGQTFQSITINFCRMLIILWIVHQLLPYIAGTLYRVPVKDMVRRYSGTT